MPPTTWPTTFSTWLFSTILANPPDLPNDTSTIQSQPPLPEEKSSEQPIPSETLPPQVGQPEPSEATDSSDLSNSSDLSSQPVAPSSSPTASFGDLLKDSLKVEPAINIEPIEPQVPPPIFLLLLTHLPATHSLAMQVSNPQRITHNQFLLHYPHPSL